MPWSTVLVVLLIALVLLGAPVLKRRHRDRWTRELAAARGWTWQARDDSIAARYAGVPFEWGRSRRSTHVMTGRHDGRDVVVFDHQFTSTDEQGRRPTTYDFSVVALAAAPTSPYLQVSPRTFFTPEAGSPQDSSIPTGDPAFDRAFRVEGPDRDFAAAVLVEAVRAFTADHPKLSWSLRDGTLLVVEKGEHTPTVLDLHLDYADGLLDRIPDEAWPAGPLPRRAADGPGDHGA